MDTSTQHTVQYTADVQPAAPGALAGHWHRTSDGRVAACGARLLPDPELWARLPRGARVCPACGS